LPTFLSHPAVPIALTGILGRRHISTRLLMAGIFAAILPDLDVLAFRFGIPYAADWGHRSFSHSLLFALIIALMGMLLARPLKTRRKTAFWFLLLATASHGILDAFTNGGLGVAFFWPVSSQRFFFPVQPIQVSPLALERFFSARGLTVLRSEFVWVWLPCLSVAAAAMIYRGVRGLMSRRKR
jgi:inner membrane protein